MADGFTGDKTSLTQGSAFLLFWVMMRHYVKFILIKSYGYNFSMLKNHFETIILYNQLCPLCAAEISHYQKLAVTSGACLKFLDLNSEGKDLLKSANLTKDQALRRLHALKEDRVISGFDAFILIWENLPRYRLLAFFAALPGINHGLKLVYNQVLAPWLYRRHVNRTKSIGKIGK